MGDETAKKVGLLDPRAGWQESVALALFNLSLECLKEKPYRPESIQVRTKLIAIIGQQKF